MDPNQDQGKTLDERLAEATAKPQETPKETVEEKLPEPVPSSNQEPAEIHEDDLSLPEGSSDRTKEQFEKLKSRLADKEAKLKELETTPSSLGKSAFDIPAPQGAGTPNYDYLAQAQADQITQNFVDPQGNVDIDGLNQALRTANDRAFLAQKAAEEAGIKFARFEENRQVKEAHKEFPEIDPLNKEKFDPKFFEFVRDRILRNRTLGAEQDLVDVARDIRSAYNPVNVAKVREETAQQIKTAQDQRNQGPIEQGRGEPRETLDNLQELRERTRQGDGAALEQRMKALGI